MTASFKNGDQVVHSRYGRGEVVDDTNPEDLTVETAAGVGGVHPSKLRLAEARTEQVKAREVERRDRLRCDQIEKFTPVDRIEREGDEFTFYLYGGTVVQLEGAANVEVRKPILAGAMGLE